MHFLLLVDLPVQQPYFICPCIVYSKRHLVSVISKYEFALFTHIDSVSSHENAIGLEDRSFGSDIPTEDGFVPAATVEHVGVVGVPFQAVNPVIM